MSNDKFASVQFDCGRMEGYSSAGSVWWYIFIIIASLQGAPLCLSSESKTSKESDGLRGRRRVEGGGRCRIRQIKRYEPKKLLLKPHSDS